jgi:hypothetical protein
MNLSSSALICARGTGTVRGTAYARAGFFAAGRAGGALEIVAEWEGRSAAAAATATATARSAPVQPRRRRILGDERTVAVTVRTVARPVIPRVAHRRTR